LNLIDVFNGKTTKVAMRLCPKSLWILQRENSINWTLHCHLMNCAFLLATDWRLYQEIDKDSTVYALMTSTEFVSDGQRQDRLMLKFQITIKKLLGD